MQKGTQRGLFRKSLPVLAVIHMDTYLSQVADILPGRAQPMQTLEDCDVATVVPP